MSSFSLANLIDARQNDQYSLHHRYLNPSFAKVQGIIGFDKIYVRGEGAYLWDVDGTCYLDLLSGYSVFNLGRNHPMIKQALSEVLTLDRPNLVKMDCPLLAGLLAEELVKRMPAGVEAVFFANSGADAVDTAVKFARAATKRPKVVFLDHAFHGLTLGTLPLNGGADFRVGFEPLMPNCEMVEMNDLSTLEDKLQKKDVAAFIAEPIQGKGVYIPEENYLPEAQKLCRKYGTIFICDEVQVGMGRTGCFLCSEHWGLEPDIITLSKSLSGGYIPVSAVIMRREIHDQVFNKLQRAQVHSTTFGQNDMAMAAGLTTLFVLEKEKLIENAALMGERFITGLKAIQEKHEMMIDVRGKGLIIGIEFGPPHALGLRTAWAATESAQKGLFTQLVVMSLMRDFKILTQVGGPQVNILKLLPPLIIGDKEVELTVTALDQIMTEARKFPGRFWGQSAELAKHALGR